MHIYIHTESALLMSVLPGIAEEAVTASGRVEPELHIIDAAYSRCEFILPLMDSGMILPHQSVLIVDSEITHSLPAVTGLVINLSEKISTINENLIKFICEMPASINPQRLLPDLLTQKEELTLRQFLFGKSIDDIAAHQRLSKNHIYSRLNSARRKMKISSLKHFSFEAVSRCVEYESHNRNGFYYD